MDVLINAAFVIKSALREYKNNLLPKDVTDAIQAAVNHKSHETMQLELAFFGGSFTALDHDYMVSLLEAAQPFVTGGTKRESVFLLVLMQLMHLYCSV